MKNQKRLDEYNKLKEELTTIHNKVIDILKEHPEARNDDKYLIWLIWEMEAKDLNDWEQFKDTTHFESVRRVRQLIQSEGKFLPTNIETMKKRRLKEELIKKIIKEGI